MLVTLTGAARHTQVTWITLKFFVFIQSNFSLSILLDLVSVIILLTTYSALPPLLYLLYYLVMWSHFLHSLWNYTPRAIFPEMCKINQSIKRSPLNWLLDWRKVNFARFSLGDNFVNYLLCSKCSALPPLLYLLYYLVMWSHFLHSLWNYTPRAIFPEMCKINQSIKRSPLDWLLDWRKVNFARFSLGDNFVNFLLCSTYFALPPLLYVLCYPIIWSHFLHSLGNYTPRVIFPEMCKINQSIKRIPLNWLLDWRKVNFDLIGLLDSYRTICFYGGGAEVTQHNGISILLCCLFLCSKMQGIYYLSNHSTTVQQQGNTFFWNVNVSGTAPTLATE